MNPRLSLVLLLCCSLFAADHSPQPTAIWPLPVPDWMRQQVLPDGLIVSQALPAKPASLARLRPGDSCLGMGGMAPCSNREVTLAVRLAALRADNSGTIRRDGQTMAVSLPAFMAWARWGIIFTDPVCPPPATLDPKHAAAWPALPMRVRLVAARAGAAAADQTWLPVLIDLGCARPGGPAIPAVAMPDPYLERVAAWWRQCATGNPPPTNDADEALFRAAHTPWPYEPEPAAGTISTGDATADQIFAGWAAGTRPDQAELTRLANRLVNTGITQLPGDGGSYLGQCFAAIADPERHGGWPFRSGYIWEPKDRSQIVTSLADWAAREPANASIAALGRVAPAVMDGDPEALVSALGTLHRASPWLANHAMGFALHAAQMHGKLPWVNTALRTMPADVTSPALIARLDRLARRPDLEPDQLLSTEGPTILLCLPDTWTRHADWQRDMQLGNGIAKELNEILWGAATDPAGLDAEACIPLARQLVLAHGMEGTPHWEADTVAAAFARAKQPADAVFWQQTAITKLRMADLEPAARTESTASYNKRLVLYRSGGMASEGDGEATPGQPVNDTSGVSNGSSLAGKRSGPWTTVGATGKTVTGYRAGEPSGRYQASNPAGMLRWSGAIAKQSLIGWWTFATPDGGTASGWFDGVDGGSRCGWWSVRAADGKLLSEGRCQAGQPVGPWRVRAADGSMQAAEAVSITLPKPPPLPGEPPPVPSDF